MLTGSIGAMVWYNLKEAKAEETFATQPVKRGTVVDKLGEPGTNELVRTVEVKSTIAGEIRKLPIEASDWVEAGDLMALIEPDPNQSLQLYQKRSAVKQARINLDEPGRAKRLCYVSTSYTPKEIRCYWSRMKRISRRGRGA